MSEATPSQTTLETNAEPSIEPADVPPGDSLLLDVVVPVRTSGPNGDPDDSVSPQAIAPSVEAALLSSDKPVGVQRLAEALELIEPEEEPAPESSGPTDTAHAAAPPTESERSARSRRTRAASAEKARREALARATRQIDAAVALLNDQYQTTGRGFRIESVAGGFRVMTLPEHARVVANLHRQRVSTRLTKAAVETLAIIAYKQPITRAQLEAIRGVACGEVLRSLMERRLITVKGRADELGRPILYGTTRQFLDHFGLASLTELPSLAELRPV